MSRSPINVMITGLGGGSHGMQILKALRLSSLPLRLIGTDITTNSFGRALVDEFETVPRADDPDYIPAILSLIGRHDIQVLFHGSEPELAAMPENAERIRATDVLLPINPPQLIARCMNKLETMSFLREHRFPCPEFHLIESHDDLRQVKTYPVVCKPHIGSGGSANVYIAQDATELELLSRLLLSQVESFITQEYIGTVDQEYTVGVLCDMEGLLVGSIAVKRQIMSALSNRLKTPNRSGRSELGLMLAISSGISQGEIGDYPQVCGYCEKVALALGARGPVNFQCRLDGDKVFIFEINPRYSGTTSMRALAGFNEPELMIRRHLLGETIERPKIKSGLVLRGLEERFLEV